MTQSTQLLKVLKRELRRHHVTYAQVGAALDVSEATVKRLFSEERFTLRRLEIICDLVGWSLHDLTEKARHENEYLQSLTWEQEQEVASDLPLLMVAISVINGFSFNDLIEYYRLSEFDAIQLLSKLDRLKLIELMPGNKIKLCVTPNFRWLANGPIQRFFLKQVESDFFNSSFDEENEKLVVLNGLLTDVSHHNIQQKMDDFIRVFNTDADGDRSLPMTKKKGTTLVLALRQWRFGLFEDFIREK